MTGSLTDAEDMLQETLLAAWRGLAGFRERSSLRSWLYRIATNQCLNALRSASRRIPAEPIPPFQPPEPSRRGEITWLQPYPDKIGRAHVCSSHLGISYAVFCLKKKIGYREPSPRGRDQSPEEDEHARGGEGREPQTVGHDTDVRLGHGRSRARTTRSKGRYSSDATSTRRAEAVDRRPACARPAPSSPRPSAQAVTKYPIPLIPITVGSRLTATSASVDDTICRSAIVPCESTTGSTRTPARA